MADLNTTPLIDVMLVLLVMFIITIPVETSELAILLVTTSQMEVEPELQFEPDANASYAASARVLHLIESSSVTNFGFVGNDKYRHFSNEN